jgi:hypothetical protein
MGAIWKRAQLFLKLFFMKTILCIHLVFLFFAACSSRDGMQTFIPGTYIRFSQHEYGTEYDTLVISLQNKSSNEYTILRKWKYERVLDGSAIEPEYKRQITSGIYNSRYKLLEETESGDIFSFDVKEKLLFNGPAKYMKL